MSYQQLHTHKPFRLFIHLTICLLTLLPLAARANATTTNEAGFTLYADNEPIEVDQITITPNDTAAAPNNITLINNSGNAVNNSNNTFTLTPSDSGNQSRTITIKVEPTGQANSAVTSSIKQMNQVEGECNDGACFTQNIDTPSPETVPQSEAQEQIAPLLPTISESDATEHLDSNANDSKPPEKKPVDRVVSDAALKDGGSNGESVVKGKEKESEADSPKKVENAPKPTEQNVEVLTPAPAEPPVEVEQSKSGDSGAQVQQARKVFDAVISFFKHIFSFFGRK